jgi:Zn-dependent protease
MDLNLAQVIAIYAIPVVLAITLHEAAHGYVALRFGDTTAYAAGRVSLNPIKHIDPVGTVAFPLALLAIGKVLGGGSFLFGWAKPVPVNFANLRHPKRDMLWVAAAGPISNLLMAIMWAFAVKVGQAAPATYLSVPLMLMGAAGVFINVIFVVLNLVPLPPLDGGRILVSLLPHRLAQSVSRIEPYGFVILIVLLLVPGMLGSVLRPVVSGAMSLIAFTFEVPVVELYRLAQLR